jgi:ribokinase
MTVVVCGSLNMDVVVQSARRPAKGETLLGAKVSFLPGGKGLNQAVAAARLGVPTVMLGAVGDDAFGAELRRFLKENGVDAAGVNVVAGSATGVALIQVAEADNAITVASGANFAYRPSMARRTARPREVWIAQFEIPVETTEALLKRARSQGATTLLNLAPFSSHPRRLMKLVDIAVLNEIELSQATRSTVQSSSALRRIVVACDDLRSAGARAVVATLGARGAVVATAEGATAVKGLKADVVDTTGAGDCFVGALAARLSQGVPLAEAARFANAAAACSVERLGAAPSMPRAKEVAARLARA